MLATKARLLSTAAALALALALPFGSQALAQDTGAGTDDAAAETAAPEGDATEGAPTEGAAGERDPSTVLARVNGTEITEGDLSAVPLPQTTAPSDDEQRAQALAQLIELLSVSTAGEKEGIADEAFERRMGLLRARQLAGLYLERSVAPQLTDEALRARYEAEVGAAEPTKEIRASHILVETEEEAQAIIEELKGGADFAELAKEKSTGPSGPNGGDLGFFGPGRMVPAFDAAARALEVGVITEAPVQTQFGFHVIKVTDSRDIQPPAFEAVREQLQNLVSRELEIEAVRKAREAAEIEIVDEGLAAVIGPIGGAQQGAAPAAQ